MTFAGVNYVAVLAAAVVSFIFGGLWYHLFSGAWLEAARLTEGPRGASGRPSAVPLIVAFIAQVVMAYVLAGTIAHIGIMTPRAGLIAGAFVWAGFVMTSMVVNHSFQGASHILTLIDGGHWLGVLLIQGAIIGWLGVPQG